MATLEGIAASSGPPTSRMRAKSNTTNNQGQGKGSTLFWAVKVKGKKAEANFFDIHKE